MNSTSEAEHATALCGTNWAKRLGQPAKGVKELGSRTLTITQQYREGKAGLNLLLLETVPQHKQLGEALQIRDWGWFPFTILHIFGDLKIPLESAGYGYAVREFLCCWKCFCSCIELPSFSAFFSPLRWKCTSKHMYYLQTCIQARSSHG